MQTDLVEPVVVAAASRRHFQLCEMKILVLVVATNNLNNNVMTYIWFDDHCDLENQYKFVKVISCAINNRMTTLPSLVAH
jgi:hypothetical protein